MGQERRRNIKEKGKDNERNRNRYYGAEGERKSETSFKEKKNALRSCRSTQSFIAAKQGRFLPPPRSFGFRPFPFSSVCLRRLYLSFRPIADLPPSPMGLKLLARRHQPGFQKRIHGIEAAVVHSVVPIFLSEPPSFTVLFLCSRIPLHSFHPHSPFFSFCQLQAYVVLGLCSVILPFLDSVVTCSQYNWVWVEREPLGAPEKVGHISPREEIAADFLEASNIASNMFQNYSLLLQLSF